MADIFTIVDILMAAACALALLAIFIFMSDKITTRGKTVLLIIVFPGTVLAFFFFCMVYGITYLITFMKWFFIKQ